MISYRWMITCLALAAALPAADMIPVEDFARAPVFSDMQISPDGQCLAFLAEHGGKQTLFFADLKTRKGKGIDADYSTGIEENEDRENDVLSFQWITDRRVVFTTAIWDQYVTGIAAIDRDGRHLCVFGGIYAAWGDSGGGALRSTEILHVFDNDEQNILMLDRSDRGFKQGEQKLYPDVVKVDTVSGGHETVLKNPGHVFAWLVDHAGCVRIGMNMTDGLKTGLIYRGNQNAPWRELKWSDETRHEIILLGFDYSGRDCYAAALSPKGHWAIYSFDPATGRLGNALIENSDYDLVSSSSELSSPPPDFNGIELEQRIFSRRKQAFAGIYYVTDGPRIHWFDPEYAAYQKSIDAALPQTVNLITSRTRDETRMLVLAFSDKDPGTYYLFDATSRTLMPIGACMAWIKPALMATTYPIKYTARDGLLIHGYLTLPPGRPHANLPLIVMPHGGPWVRDVWGFDPLVQFLASRGYAVLQMNYRGSPGYGEDFYKEARHEIGRGIQDDIEDGARWAIAKKFADPQRLAIVGASYGGYSALFALGHNPDLYRCGISIFGVTDWFALIQDRDNPETKFAYQYWVQQIGDPKNDEVFLKSISPVNFADKITAPLLIIQGKEDHTVPPKQAHAMIDALKKAGHPPESLFIPYAGHGFNSADARTAEYKAIEAFLLKNLGPGAPFEEPAPAAAPAKPAG